MPLAISAGLSLNRHMHNKYRLGLQTSRGLKLVGSTNDISELPAMLRTWYENIAGRGVYDDQIRTVLLYVYDKESDSYLRLDGAQAVNKRDAVNKLTNLVYKHRKNEQ